MTDAGGKRIAISGACPEKGEQLTAPVGNNALVRAGAGADQHGRRDRKDRVASGLQSTFAGDSSETEALAMQGGPEHRAERPQYGGEHGAQGPTPQREMHRPPTIESRRVAAAAAP